MTLDLFLVYINKIRRVMKHNKKGFTLLEILVVVLIVGILAAVAFPFYQKTVYRNRYSTLIPVTKSVASANEINYLRKNSYAGTMQDLDVIVSNDIEGLNIILGNTEDASYVLTSRTDLPGNTYIIYQKNSSNFPNEIHCEADPNNERAVWLCAQELGGTPVSGSITPNYNTYVLIGSGSGNIQTVRVNLSNIKCEDSETTAQRSCQITHSDAHSITKKTCNNKKNENTCTYTTYTDDGAQRICYGNKAVSQDGECIPESNGKYGTNYDADGNYTQLLCNNYTSGSGCYALGEEGYDADGTHISAKNRYCVQWDSIGKCIAYQQNKGNDHMAIFDENHKYWIRGDCGSIDPEGNCLSYTGGRVEEWDYDENGNTLVYRDNTCNSMSNTLECSSYSNYKTTTYDYNANGRTESTCEASTASGNCNSITTKDYNTTGQQLNGYQRSCKSWDSSGNCIAYKSGTDNTFTYNSNNKETSHVVVNCSTYDSNNNCTKYSSGRASYRSYDENGTTITSKTDITCNSYTGTTCNGWTIKVTPYKNGKENTSGVTTVSNNCINVNMTTGQCLD